MQESISENSKRRMAIFHLKECSKFHDCKECISKRIGLPCKIFGTMYKESMWDYREKVQKML